MLIDRQTDKPITLSLVHDARGVIKINNVTTMSCKLEMLSIYTNAMMPYPNPVHRSQETTAGN